MSINRKKTDKSLKSIEKLTGEKLTLGRFLWAIRKGEDLSQVEFAEMLGISKQYLCDIERGRKFVSAKAAVEYAEKLEYSTIQFVRLCLQDLVDRQGVSVQVSVKVLKHASKGKISFA